MSFSIASIPVSLSEVSTSADDLFTVSTVKTLRNLPDTYGVHTHIVGSKGMKFILPYDKTNKVFVSYVSDVIYRMNKAAGRLREEGSDSWNSLHKDTRAKCTVGYQTANGRKTVNLPLILSLLEGVNVLAENSPDTDEVQSYRMGKKLLRTFRHYAAVVSILKANDAIVRAQDKRKLTQEEISRIVESNDLHEMFGAKEEEVKQAA